MRTRKKSRARIGATDAEIEDAIRAEEEVPRTKKQKPANDSTGAPTATEHIAWTPILNMIHAIAGYDYEPNLQDLLYAFCLSFHNTFPSVFAKYCHLPFAHYTGEHVFDTATWRLCFEVKMNTLLHLHAEVERCYSLCEDDLHLCIAYLCHPTTSYPIHKAMQRIFANGGVLSNMQAIIDHRLIDMQLKEQARSPMLLTIMHDLNLIRRSYAQSIKQCIPKTI